MSECAAYASSRRAPTCSHGCGSQCDRQRAGHCPQRVNDRPATDTTKSRAGRRQIGLPDELCSLLRTHKARQDAERRRAGQLWITDGWIFATETGEAINPSPDRSHWKALLAAAEVTDGRLHEARHTAATVLLVPRRE
jgi:integrase